MTEETLLETLKDWEVLKERLKTLNEQLQEKTFKVTATMSSDVKVMSGYSEVSKLESFCFSRMKITDERDEILRKLNACISAFKKSNLLPIEKLTITATVRKESLLDIAKKSNVSQAGIYRIRKKAIKKMLKTMQNEVKSR